VLTVHHLGISQSERIVWLCEELQVPYRLERYDREGGRGRAPAAYKALHPLGTAPVITDGDVVLAESGAIVEYLIEQHGNGRLAVPKGQPNFADYLFWFHFANGSLLPGAMIPMMLSLVGAAPENPVVAAMRQREAAAFALVERRLGQTRFLAGNEFSAADIMNVFGLTTLRTFMPRDLAAFPNIRAYLKRIGERPAYRRAMAKGDPDLTPMLD
jgi:glutathione S-transferase